MDILATSLGRLDNPSRVVGVSGTVGAKEFFGPKKRVVSRSKMSTEELDAMVNAHGWTNGWTNGRANGK